MAGTINGSATIHGRSKLIGNKLDEDLLVALREWADVVLVGASTAIKENYYGIKPGPDGQSPAPLAMVSKSLKFDLDKQLFWNYTTPHIYLVPHDAPALGNSERKDFLAQHGTFVKLSNNDPRTIIETLAKQGFQRILCEGGPTLLGRLISKNLVDQFYLTISPWLTPAVESPLTNFTNESLNSEELPPLALALEGANQSPDSTVFLRYGRTRTP